MILNLTHFYQILSSSQKDISKCKPTVSVITGDFNTMSSSWWSEDVSTSEGRTKLYSLTSSNGFLQLITEPAHIKTNRSSCIDLVSTDHPNLSVISGVHASFQPNCHYQIVHTKLNLNNSSITSKSLLSVLKTFYNKKTIPLIPPLLVNDKFVTDINTKACIFNKFFAKQCTPLQNDSVLPVNQIFPTQSRLSFLDFNEDEFPKIIRTLNIYKAHGYDDFSIRMIKTCDKSLTKPLIILFKIQRSLLIIKISGRDLTLYLYIKRIINN